MNKKLIILFVCFLLVFTVAVSAAEAKEDSFFSKIINFFKQLFGIEPSANPSDYKVPVEAESQTAGDNASEETSLEDNITTTIIEEIDSSGGDNLTQEDDKEINASDENNISKEDSNIDANLSAEIEQCKKDLKDEPKVYDYENVCECSYHETDVCDWIQITFTYDTVKTIENWTESDILKELCICQSLDPEEPVCEDIDKPYNEDAYIFNYSGSENWNYLSNSILNYCDGFSAIRNVELEQEDEDFFYTKVKINEQKITEDIDVDAEGWPDNIYLKFAKTNSTYYEKRVSKSIDEYLNIIIENHGGELKTKSTFASIWAIYTSISPIELIKIVKYSWIKGMTPSYKPCDDSLCPSDNYDCCA